MEGGGDKTMTRKQKKKMQKMKHNKGGSSKAAKGSDPGGHPHTDVNCYFADPTYTQGKALEDLLGPDSYAHAKAVNDQYRDLVTQWVMDEITAYDVHDRGEDKGMVHATLDVTGALICTFTVLLVAQMKDTCNYGEELEAKYGTVAIAYMNGFAQGAGFDPDFKIQEECVEAFNDAGLGAVLVFVS